jgi:hypothetical protein
VKILLAHIIVSIQSTWVTDADCQSPDLSRVGCRNGCLLGYLPHLSESGPHPLVHSGEHHPRRIGPRQAKGFAALLAANGGRVSALRPSI